MSLRSCFTICSTIASLPRVVSTMREKARIDRDVDGQRVDVEAASGEETDHASQLAEAILDEDGENVALGFMRDPVVRAEPCRLRAAITIS